MLARQRHPEMSACVRLRASQASAALESIESRIREAIANSVEPEHTEIASKAFEGNVKSFRKYLKEQCAFVYTRASVGNGSEDNMKACEAELDISRMEQLDAASWWLKK